MKWLAILYGFLFKGNVITTLSTPLLKAELYSLPSKMTQDFFRSSPNSQAIFMATATGLWQSVYCFNKSSCRHTGCLELCYHAHWPVLLREHGCSIHLSISYQLYSTKMKDSGKLSPRLAREQALSLRAHKCPDSYREIRADKPTRSCAC